MHFGSYASKYCINSESGYSVRQIYDHTWNIGYLNWLTCVTHFVLFASIVTLEKCTCLWWQSRVKSTLHYPLHGENVYTFCWAAAGIGDRLCGLVVRVTGYRTRGPEFDSRRYQIFWEVVGVERGPLRLVRIIEELLEWKSSGSCLENRINGRRIRCANHATPSILKSWH
jgi:hypothetical protein